MANPLADRIRALTLDKIDFANDGAEAVVDDIVTSALALDEASDYLTLLAAGDVDQEDIANALVDLADLFDDVDLSPAQQDSLSGVVDRLLKTGSAEQKQAAKDLFAATLAFGLKAKATNAYFDDLLATTPE
jgi:hypothetical protein